MQPAAPARKKRVTFYEARRRNELAKARHQELNLKVREGELVEWAVIQSAAFQRDRAVRDSILNVPARISGILAAESDQAKVHTILTKELLQCLVGLAK